MSIFTFNFLYYYSIVLDNTYNNSMKIFADRIKYLRERKGLMQKVVAKDLFISNTTLSNYEQDVCSPNPEFIVRVAKYYNVSCDYLLGMTNTPEIKQPNAVDINELINKKQSEIIKAIEDILTNK